MMKKLTRFATIGILNTGPDILILNLLFWLWSPHGQALMIAWENMLAFSVGAIQSFLLNKFWTFKDTSPITFQQVLKFALVTVGNMILNTFILEALIKILGVSPDEAGLTAVALKAGVAVIMMVISFCGMLLIVFVGSKKEGDELAMPDNTYIPYTVNQGYGAALVSGFEAATKELTMFMDSDGQFSIISLARMLPHIDEVDAVFGYRIKRQDTWMRNQIYR